MKTNAKNTVIRKMLTIMVMCGMMCAVAVPTTAAAANSTVNTYSVCIRSTPNGEVIGYATDGTVFDVTKTSNGWLYSDSIPSTSGRDLSGWISASLCTTGASGSSTSGSSSNSGTSGKSVIVTAAIAVTLRSGPDISYDAIGWIGNGVVLNVLEQEGKWHKVTYNGKTGWISGKYAQAVGSSGSSSSSSSSSGSQANKNEISLDFWDSFNYAKTYWNKKNNDYFYYDNNNCCNFVSQVLVAGGFPISDNFRDQSLPFVRISEFVPYMRNTHGIAYIESPAERDIEAGDVILTNGGKHVMFVMQNNTSSHKIYCSGNTNDQDSAVIPLYAIDAVLKTSALYD